MNAHVFAECPACSQKLTVHKSTPPVATVNCRNGKCAEFNKVYYLNFLTGEMQKWDSGVQDLDWRGEVKLSSLEKAAIEVADFYDKNATIIPTSKQVMEILRRHVAVAAADVPPALQCQSLEAWRSVACTCSVGDGIAVFNHGINCARVKAWEKSRSR